MSSISAGTTLLTGMVHTSDMSGGLQFLVNTTNVALTIDINGNLGVGTSSPGARLAVDSGADALVADFNSTNASGPYTRYKNSGTTFADVGSALSVVGSGAATDFGVNARTGNIVLSTGQTARVTVAAAGSVGIGTASPTAKVDVVATNMAGGPAIGARYNNSNARIGFGIGNANGFAYLGYNTNNAASTDTPTYDLSQAATRLRMDNGQFSFSVAPSGAAGNPISFTTAMTLDADGNLIRKRATAIFSDTADGYQALSGGSSIGLGGAIVLFGESHATVPNQIHFRNSGNTTRMTLDASGNLGVGVTAPTQQLTLGNDSTQIITKGIGFKFQGTELGTFTFTGNTGEMKFNSGFSGWGGYMTWFTNGTQRMMLDAYGQVGVGTTPRAWNGDYRSVDVGINSSFYGRVASAGYTGMSANAYRDNVTGAWKYISNTTAGRLEIDSGYLAYYSAGVGTAGNTIPFANPFTITPTGNVEHAAYTKLGTGYTSANDYHPAIKTKVIKGTVHSNAANVSAFATHGVTAAKIISITGLVTDTSNERIPPNPGVSALNSFQYDVYESAGYLYVSTNNTSGSNGNSAAIFSRPITAVVTYEE